MCEETWNDPDFLVNTIIKALVKIRLCGDLSNVTLNYFAVEDPKFARFYLLPKIHKRLHWLITGRPVISNCSFYNENISSFLNYHLQPLAQKVKSYIKNTNLFLNKIKKLESLPDRAILCTMDVVAFTLIYHMGKVLRLSIGFWKLEITKISQVILWRNLRKWS